MLYTKRHNPLVTMFFCNMKITSDESHIWDVASKKVYPAPSFAVVNSEMEITRFISAEYDEAQDKYIPQGYIHYQDNLYYHNSLVDAELIKSKDDPSIKYYQVRPYYGNVTFIMDIEAFLSNYKEIEPKHLKL